MHFETNIKIAAPSGFIWAFILNPDNLHKWLSGFESYKLLSGTPGEVGVSYMLHSKDRGRSIKMKQKLTEATSGESIKFKLSHDVVDATMLLKFEEGSTETQLSMKMEMTFRALSFKLFAPMMKKSFQRRQEDDLQRLKEVIEREYTT